MGIFKSITFVQIGGISLPLPTLTVEDPGATRHVHFHDFPRGAS